MMHKSYYTALNLGNQVDEVEAPLKFNVGLFAKYVTATVALTAGIVGIMNPFVGSTPVTTNLMVAPNGVQSVPTGIATRPAVPAMSAAVPQRDEVHYQEPATNMPSIDPTTHQLMTGALIATTLNMLAAPEAQAALATGRTASLVHPASMAAMFALSLFAAYQGFQWRNTRTIGTSITAAKAEVTAAAAKLSTPLEGSAADALKNGDISSADKAILQSIVPLEQKVADLQAQRKELTAGNHRDKHWAAGSAILAVGVSSAIVGPVNTYLRVGKLFPGPHLYVGAAMVSGWAIATGLVPAMQKGNETARSIHIAINVVNTAFFAWQVVTGWEIVVKVWGFTSWP